VVKIETGSPAEIGRGLRSSPDASRLEHRGDIEGLRAVAILLVVAAHAGLPWLPGGYVGVDVFFVLSGYLITFLLMLEIDSTGGIRLIDFYARRLKRLLPGLALMIVGTMAMAAVLLAPFEQLDQTGSAGAASMWVSNLYFAFSNLDYFGPAADTNLFLHTWSLGVEEQFYLFWPAWLMILLGVRNRERSRPNPVRLRKGMLATCGISLVLSIVLTYTHPPWAFYLMPFRAWQFALGALVALRRGRNERQPECEGNGKQGAAPWATAGGWTGLGLILLSAVFLDGRVPYPGGWALLPSVGAAAVLAAGACPSGRNVSGFLSLRPLQRIGNVSYAWYLWHWPILLLGASIGPYNEPLHRAALVAISLVFAVISHRLIEMPLRFSNRLAVNPRLVVAGSSLVMAGAVALCTGWMDAAESWARQPGQFRYRAVRLDIPSLYAMGCDEWFRSEHVKVCGFGPEEAEHTAVLMGDSIGVQWFPALRSLYTRPGWRLVVMTKSSCPMVDESFFYSRIGSDYSVCDRWRDAALRTLYGLRPDLVFLGSAVSYPFDKDQWQSGTARVIELAGAAAREVYVLRATPTLPFDGPNCLARRDWRRQFLPGGECSAAAGNPWETDVHTWLQRAASGRGNATVLDLNPLVCPGGRCQAERDGRIIFRDSQHVSARFIETLADEVASCVSAAAAEHRGAENAAVLALRPGPE